MPYDPDNTRFRQITATSYGEQRAAYFAVTYDPLTRAGSILFQHQEYLYADDQLCGVNRDNGGKLYAVIGDLIQRTPEPGEVIDPITGHDLATVSGAGIQYWLTWLFDRLHNEHAQEPTP